MSTLLAHHERRAAHGRHVCRECRRLIAAREIYLDQRVAGDGTVWTYRAHLRCWRIVIAQTDDIEDWFGDINDLLDGHTIECAGATERGFVGCDCCDGES